MKRCLWLMIVLAAVLGLGRAFTQPMADPPASNAREVSCLVKIDCDSSILPLTPENIETLIRGSSVAPAVAQKVLGIAPGDFAGEITVGFSTRPGPQGPPMPGRGFRPERRPPARMPEEGPPNGPPPDDFNENNPPPRPPENPAGPGMPGQMSGAPGQMPGGSGMMPGGPGMMPLGMMGPPRRDEPGAQNPLPTLVGVLSVRFNKPRDAKPADDFLKGVVEKLRSALIELNAQRQKDLQERLQSAGKQFETAQNALRQLQSQERQLQDKAGQLELSREVVLDTFRNLENNRQKLEMELAGKKARRAAVETQISRITQKISEESSKDPLVGDLEKVIALRQKQANDAAAGNIEALEKLANARVQLAQHREVLARRSGGDLLGRLNDELTMLVIDTAEMEERLDFLTRRLADLRQRKVLELAEDYAANVAPKLPPARDAAEQAMRMKDALTRQSELVRPPTVVQLGGK